MPLPTSGPLTLTAIRNELEPTSGASGLSLGFYRGKTYSIAAGGQRTISSTPKFSDFYGLAGVTYRLDDAIYSLGINADSSIAFGSDGIFYAVPNNSPVRQPKYNWVTGAAASLYSVRRTQISGDTLTTGAANVWLPLNVTQVFARAAAAIERVNTSLYEIRLESSGAVVESATITLETPGST